MNKYLYEIIDDYKSSVLESDKIETFNKFCSAIWECDNIRSVYSKSIKYTVKKNLLNTDMGQVFDKWSEVSYKGFKSMSQDTAWYSLIRQKINNIYTMYFDKEVILKQDYMRLLNYPKRLYYQWINDGLKTSAQEVSNEIDTAMAKAIELKQVYQKQKIAMNWEAYQQVINEMLRNIFNTCKLIESYEINHHSNNLYDFINEDNFYVSYICTSLEFEIMKWQKKYYGVRRGRNISYKRCKMCGCLIENTGNKKIYCTDCAAKREKERKRKNAHKYRVAK